jgi:hypothetical protein
MTTSTTLGHATFTRVFSWPALYLGEMAKALIDDINDALFLPRADT